MNYYKVIKNGIVIDANCVFLRWQDKHRTMVVCRPENGQFIQSSDQQVIWRVDWLNPIQNELSGKYDTVDAVEITAEEYAELRQRLDSGMNVNAPDTLEETTDTQAGENTIENETIMTPEQMRRKLIEMQQQNEILLGCVLELSEIVYAG